jgi:hypothetical protein
MTLYNSARGPREPSMVALRGLKTVLKECTFTLKDESVLCPGNVNTFVYLVKLCICYDIKDK